MSSQNSASSWGNRAGTASEAGSDLQQMVARVLSVLSRRRWLFILPLLTGTLAALICSVLLPRRYVLNTLFERRDDVVVTTLLTNNSPYSFETLRRSLVVDLIGYNAICEAVEKLALEDAGEPVTGQAPKQAAINGLARQLSVNLAEKSQYLDLIELKYTGDDPDYGVRLVTCLKDNYIARTRQRIGLILTKSHEFFSQEAQKRRSKVAKMEAELLQMSVQHPGVDPSDPTLLDQRLLSQIQTIDELTRRKAETEVKLDACREYLKQLEAGDAPSLTNRAMALLPSTVPNPRRQYLAQQIQNVENEIADARTIRKMTDLHPTMVGLRQKLEELRREYEAGPMVVAAEQRGNVAGNEPAAASPFDAERRRVQMEMKSATEVLAQTEAEIQRRQKGRAHLEEEKGKLFERRQAYVVAQQALQSAKSDLNIWDNHVDAISRVLTAEAESRGIQFATVEDARRPAKPSSPTLPGILLISLAAGLALGTASVFLREILDRSIRSAHRIRQALGIPVLEAIEEIRVGREPRVWSRRRMLPVLATVECLLVLGAAALAYVSVEKPLVYEQWSMRAASLWAPAVPESGEAGQLAEKPEPFEGGERPGQGHSERS